jgi:hypothetical protein
MVGPRFRSCQRVFDEQLAGHFGGRWGMARWGGGKAGLVGSLWQGEGGFRFGGDPLAINQRSCHARWGLLIARLTQSLAEMRQGFLQAARLECPNQQSRCSGNYESTEAPVIHGQHARQYRNHRTDYCKSRREDPCSRKSSSPSSGVQHDEQPSGEPYADYHGETNPPKSADARTFSGDHICN